MGMQNDVRDPEREEKETGYALHLLVAAMERKKPTSF
jgi:hypothetical protein